MGSVDWWVQADPVLRSAVVAALVSAAVSVTGFLVSSRTARGIHQERLVFDEKLAERKFEFDKEIAQRKFDLDARLADRKRRQDLAEEVLAGFYEVRDIMVVVRSPGGYGDEGKSRKREPGESDDVAASKDAYFAILERFDTRREVVAKIMSRKYRMAAWFGLEAAAPFQTLQEAIAKVIVSARMLVRVSRADGSAPQFAKWETDIWWDRSDPDPIAIKIDGAIDEIERVCGPILRESG